VSYAPEHSVRQRPKPSRRGNSHCWTRHENCDIHTLSMTWPNFGKDVVPGRSITLKEIYKHNFVNNIILKTQADLSLMQTAIDHNYLNVSATLWCHVHGIYTTSSQQPGHPISEAMHAPRSWHINQFWRWGFGKHGVRLSDSVMMLVVHCVRKKWDQMF